MSMHFLHSGDSRWSPDLARGKVTLALRSNPPMFIGKSRPTYRDHRGATPNGCSETWPGTHSSPTSTLSPAPPLQRRQRTSYWPSRVSQDRTPEMDFGYTGVEHRRKGRTRPGRRGGSCLGCARHDVAWGIPSDYPNFVSWISRPGLQFRLERNPGGSCVCIRGQLRREISCMWKTESLMGADPREFRTMLRP